ncbi:hypothetical protein KCU59_g8742, partial [Aureobasidium melanogenum]
MMLQHPQHPSPLSVNQDSCCLPTMPSPRGSPALRPSSPLSPRFETTPRYELQPPSPRGLHPRSAATSSQMRHRNAATANTLKLPGLPRFHPANFPSSQSSSIANTPGTGPTSPSNPPVSPKAQQRLYSEAQKQLYLYQREILAAQAAVTAAANAGSGRPQSARFEKPLSPRLAPLGSPGPVTPLELEGQDGYLLAGAHVSSAAAHAAAAQEAAAQLSAQHSDLVDKLIEQEVRRSTDLDRAMENITR